MPRADTVAAAALCALAAAAVLPVPWALSAPAQRKAATPPVYSCRYPTADVVAQLKAQAEALRRIEREAADRIAGLDTRPYDWLLEQARAGHTAIADPLALAAEDDLRRCRNFIRPLRRDCEVFAAALVRVIEELAAGEVSKEAKQAYAMAAPPCESPLSLPPLRTALRTAE